MKKIFCVLLSLCSVSLLAQSVSSPDGKYMVNIEGMTYSVTFNGKTIIEQSQ